MIVNEQDHPSILKAMHCIDEDTNGQGLQIPVKKVPDRWDSFIPRIEAVLASLSQTERDEGSEPLPAHVKPSPFLDSQFYTFCNGEYEDRGRIANKSEDHVLACEFLDDYFEDFTHTTETGPEDIMNTVRRRQIEFLEMIQRESTTGLTPEQAGKLMQLRNSLTA